MGFRYLANSTVFETGCRAKNKEHHVQRKYLFLEALEGHLSQYEDICNLSQAVVCD
jgi:hypothetical protein